MIRAAILTLGALMCAGGAAAQDVEAGRKAAGMCRTCHGLDGIARVPQAPHIAGEAADYLATQLYAFRRGERRNEMMNIVAGGLSDAQIADLSAWYASQTVTASLTSDPAEAPETCTACHGADGISVVDGAPNLAGDDPFYLVEQLRAYRDGTRSSEIMSPVAAGLTDDQIRAAAAWYGAVTLTVD